MAMILEINIVYETKIVKEKLISLQLMTETYQDILII
jgi:hypothetical protein